MVAASLQRIVPAGIGLTPKSWTMFRSESAGGFSANAGITKPARSIASAPLADWARAVGTKALAF